jgi:hypothetical protein
LELSLARLDKDIASIHEVSLFFNYFPWFRVNTNDPEYTAAKAFQRILFMTGGLGDANHIYPKPDIFMYGEDNLNPL